MPRLLFASGRENAQVPRAALTVVQTFWNIAFGKSYLPTRSAAVHPEAIRCPRRSTESTDTVVKPSSRTHTHAQARTRRRAGAVSLGTWSPPPTPSEWSRRVRGSPGDVIGDVTVAAPCAKVVCRSPTSPFIALILPSLPLSRSNDGVDVECTRGTALAR